MSHPSELASYFPNCTREQLINAELRFAVYDSIKKVPQKLWDSSVPRHHLFLRTPYLEALESSGCEGMAFYYVVFLDAWGLAGIAAFQVLQISGENVLRPDVEIAKSGENDTAVSEYCPAQYVKRHLKSFVIKQIQNMNFGLLICGNAFVTGEHGAWFRKDVEGTPAFDYLTHAIEYVQQLEADKGRAVSMIMVKDFHPDTLPHARRLADYDYKEVRFEPNMELAFMPDWSNFDDYLASMSSKYRIHAKRIRKKGAGVQKRFLDLNEVEQYKQRIFDMYKFVCDRASFNLCYATPEYFVLLKRHLNEKFKVLAYFTEQNEFAGFISMFVCGNELEAHFTGYDEKLNYEHTIYPNVLYDIVETGINEGVRHIYFGRTAPVIKSTVGAKTIHMNGFLRHQNCFHNTLLIRPLVNHLRPQENDGELRHPFKKAK